MRTQELIGGIEIFILQQVSYPIPDLKYPIPELELIFDSQP